MNKPNILVDNKALEMNRNRATGRDQYFLHELAITEIKDRLSSINRDFSQLPLFRAYQLRGAKHFQKLRLFKIKKT